MSREAIIANDKEPWCIFTQTHTRAGGGGSGAGTTMGPLTTSPDESLGKHLPQRPLYRSSRKSARDVCSLGRGAVRLRSPHEEVADLDEGDRGCLGGRCRPVGALLVAQDPVLQGSPRKLVKCWGVIGDWTNVGRMSFDWLCN